MGTHTSTRACQRALLRQGLGDSLFRRLQTATFWARLFVNGSMGCPGVAELGDTVLPLVAGAPGKHPRRHASLLCHLSQAGLIQTVAFGREASSSVFAAVVLGGTVLLGVAATPEEAVSLA